MSGLLKKILNGLVVIFGYYAGLKEMDKDSAQNNITDDTTRILNEDKSITDRYTKYRNKLRNKRSTSQNSK